MNDAAKIWGVQVVKWCCGLAARSCYRFLFPAWVANWFSVSFFWAKTGYSSDYIEEVLHKKKEEKTTLAIDLHRPTYIKVNRKYLHPDTLDAYGLPWEWDGVCIWDIFPPPLLLFRTDL